ncbi:hypothetical protein C0992_011890 [Termitomyces sp. T32_za158]|nr:hypothetical protein C0992_011890 [Termitomyces sp. T32_za158]
MSFGGRSWPISEADFKLSQLTQALCLGAFFELNTGASAPAWIVGDTFLKNVYSVFRYDPPSIGFAELSNAALALNGANTPVPSPTIGSIAATVVATSTFLTSANSGLIHLYLPTYQLVLALVGVMTIVFSSGFCI